MMKLLHLLPARRSVLFLIALTTMALSIQAGPYYVVVSAFHQEQRAAGFAGSLKGAFPQAAVHYDEASHLYYVYVMETARHREAEAFCRELRQARGLSNAWIYADMKAIAREEVTGQGPSDFARLELYTGGSILLGGDDYLSVSKNNRVAPKPEAVALRSLSFVAETTTGRVLPGKVLLTDRHGRVISTLKTGEAVGFSWRSNSGKLLAVCQVPGYSMASKEIDLDDLTMTEDLNQNEEGVWEVHFPVTHVDVDEVNLRYHCLFYPDAAILRPQAEEKIETLISLMEADPRPRIEINTHSNSGSRRPLAVRGNRDAYFDLSSAHEKMGSDKQLTALRAETLRDYLVARGIDPGRIDVMGWGSLAPVVTENKAKAHLNERVDVELTLSE